MGQDERPRFLEARTARANDGQRETSEEGLSPEVAKIMTQLSWDEPGEESLRFRVGTQVPLLRQVGSLPSTV